MLGEIRAASDLGAAVRRQRVEHGLAQREFAEAIGTSQRYLSELERGMPKRFDENFLGVLTRAGVSLIFECDN